MPEFDDFAPGSNDFAPGSNDFTGCTVYVTVFRNDLEARSADSPESSLTRVEYALSVHYPGARVSALLSPSGDHPFEFFAADAEERGRDKWIAGNMMEQMPVILGSLGEAG